MTRKTLSAALLVLVLPGAALALPQVGDVVGTKADDVRTAMDAAGCPVDKFEVEDGMVEARCHDVASGKMYELYINTKTGAVVRMKQGD